jgi:molybdopterin-guanine dinucleotide biosynthesis protein A/rhodanese-related sulfurtransferase
VTAVVVGAVLVGGASARMGRDKAWAPFLGRPLVAVAADALAGAGLRRRLAVGDADGRCAELGLEPVPDRHPGEGPLGGLLSALAAAGADADVVVVLSCDLVRIGAADVARLVATLAAEERADVAAPVRSGRPQLLTAAYRPRAADALGAAFAAGERSVRRAAARLVLAAVTGVGDDALDDADTPADLARFAEVARSVHARLGGERSVGSAPMANDAVPEVPQVDVVDVVDDVPHVAAVALAAARDAETVLIDVREPDEWAEVRASGARHLPLGELEARVGEVPTDRPVYVICRSGARSQRAALFLRGAGVDAANVAGGTLAWAEAGLPTDHG